ncbi:replication initiator protein A [Fuerstiella marisgermanici]|uniref:Replication initiator protein A n=1 Tax=Fuerstiella marisgermanici TaxID=1891926 RepID=A0A1P8WH69_9PLAN|nr:replication initiator protein A [Fuerstiella marisgermanici]APZ93421.1 Replication initiator protein A [Fuerstiella marisgermanici]
MTQAVTTRSPLLPDRYPDPDFFVCDLFNAAPKGDMASMQHPIFSLSTKPDRHVRRYDHGDLFVEVKPSSDGLATVHDRDVLIYCISQVMAALNKGQQVSQVIRFQAHDLLKSTNRMTNGRGYEGLKSALERLAGTRISTNITTGGKEVFNNFGLIERFEIVREKRDGRMQDVEVKLSDWVFSALEHNEVLTLHRDYFRLRKPIERRLYELARKHCGRQSEWRVSLPLLQKKCGAVSSLREFRRLVTNIVREDKLHSHIPDYAVSLSEDDMVIFANRGTTPTVPTGASFNSQISEDGYEAARAAAPGWDIYHLEQEWRAWITDPPHSADAAFAGFSAMWFEKRGYPG